MEKEDLVGKIQRYSVPTCPNNMYMCLIDEVFHCCFAELPQEDEF